MLNGFRRGLANIISPDNDKFLEAFLKQIGGLFTRYPREGKTYVEQGYGANSDVYSAIQQMSVKTSSIPYTVRKIDDKGAKSKLDKLNAATKSVFSPQQEIKKRILETKAFQEEELDFPLKKPNELQTWTEILSLYKTFLKTTGNVYFYMMKPKDGLNKGVPKRLYVLPSHLVQIVLKNNIDLLGEESPISHYMLIEGNQYVEFDAEDIIHIKYANPFYDEEGGHLYGLSPLRAALLNIQSSNEAVINNNKVLKNGGAFGFIHSKGQKAMTPEQALAIKQRLKEMDSDDDRLGRITGISAEIGFTRVGLSTEELKPFEYLSYDQKAICNVLGWSVKLLNNNEDSSSLNNGGMDSELKRMVSDNIMPDLNLLCNALNDKFIPLFDGYEDSIIEFDYSELPEMQQDMKTMMEWIELAVNIGIMSRNEGREVLKLGKSENEYMDVFTVKDDVIPLDEALENDFSLTPVA